MATKRPGHMAALIAVGWLAGFSAITGSAPNLYASEIRDAGAMFSPAVVKSATENLNQLEQRDKVSVNIETHASVPDEKLAAFKALPKAAWGSFYQDWIKEIVRKDKSNGVFVLITKSPGHLEFYVPEGLKRRGFDSSIQSGFSSKLIESFKKKEFDEGLTSAVSYLNTVAGPNLKTATASSVYNPRKVQRSGQNSVRHDMPGGQQNPAVIPGQVVRHNNSWGIWNWVILGVVVWVVFMVISAVIRGISGGSGGGYQAGYGQPGYGQPGYGGGGGFMSNMLGGLAGAMAGNWIYNSMFNSHSSAHGADWSGSNDNSGLMGDSSNDSGSYGGGDFGDSSGGGDFGGGDFGGGDFGGGDFGGGDF